MWRVRRPAGGPVTGTGSLRGSSFRLPYKRTTASSRLTSPHPPSPSHHPRSPSLSFLRSSTLRFASLLVRPRAHLRACFSLISRSSDRPFLYPSFSHHHHPPCLLSSFARKRCHTRETAHRLFIPALLPSAEPTRRSSLSRSRIVLPLAFNPWRFVSSPHYPLLPSFSPRKAEVMRRIPFFILIPPLPPPPRTTDYSVAVLVFLFVHFVVRSVIGPTIPTNGHATIYPTRRCGQSAGRKDEVRKTDGLTDGRALVRPREAERVSRYVSRQVKRYL